MIRIYGASDDLIEIEGDVEEGICRVSGKGPSITIGGREGGVVVRMTYGHGDSGVWAAFVRQIDENVPIPWSVTIDVAPAPHRYPPGGCGYSTRVSIDCPPETPVTWKGRKP